MIIQDMLISLTRQPCKAQDLVSFLKKKTCVGVTQKWKNKNWVINVTSVQCLENCQPVSCLVSFFLSFFLFFNDWWELRFLLKLHTKMHLLKDWIN